MTSGPLTLAMPNLPRAFSTSSDVTIQEERGSEALQGSLNPLDRKSIYGRVKTDEK